MQLVDERASGASLRGRATTGPVLGGSSQRRGTRSSVEGCFLGLVWQFWYPSRILCCIIRLLYAPSPASVMLRVYVVSYMRLVLTPPTTLIQTLYYILALCDVRYISSRLCQRLHIAYIRVISFAIVIAPFTAASDKSSRPKLQRPTSPPERARASIMHPTYVRMYAL